MSGIKKQQHYVWRRYLASWATNNKIAFLHKKENLIITNMNNVGKNGAFYKIHPLGKKEKELFYQLLPNLNFPEYLQQWIKLYIDKTSGVFENIENPTQEQAKLIDETRKNLVESLLENIEKSSIQHLESLSQGNINFLSDDKHRITFCHFIAWQYLRTRRMQEMFISGFNAHCKEFDTKSLFEATRIAEVLDLTDRLFFENYGFLLVKNTTTSDFITGDQPIINLSADYKGKIKATDITLYYPITPTKALLILPKIRHSTIQLTDSDAVRRYNQQISNFSYDQLYAKTMQELVEFKSVL